MTHRCRHHNPSPVNTDLSAGVDAVVEEEGSGLGEEQTRTVEDMACRRPLKMFNPQEQEKMYGAVDPS